MLSWVEPLPALSKDSSVVTPLGKSGKRYHHWYGLSDSNGDTGSQSGRSSGSTESSKTNRMPLLLGVDFPGGSVVKNLPANAADAGDAGLISGLGRFSGKGNSNPLQYSCLENPMDRGTWRATVHGVAQSWTWLSDWTHTAHNPECANPALPMGTTRADAHTFPCSFCLLTHSDANLWIPVWHGVPSPLRNRKKTIFFQWQ